MGAEGAPDAGRDGGGLGRMVVGAGPVALDGAGETCDGMRGARKAVAGARGLAYSSSKAS